jgi:ParB family chromosome partitioning protein
MMDTNDIETGAIETAGTVAGGGEPGSIEAIPIDRIDVVNPRERNRKVFGELVQSIRLLGLKKPITVTPREQGDETRYLLICGQGRLEAFRALGQSKIPARIVEATDEDAFVMSLIENIARRHMRPTDLIAAIKGLRERGNDANMMARKLGYDRAWISGVLAILDKGEDRLVAAIEAGRLPLSIAMDIVRAGGDDGEVQKVLTEAYEKGTLRGKRLMTVKRLIDERRRRGKRLGNSSTTPSRQPLSSTSLVRAYTQEIERQKLFIAKADLVQERLTFITTAVGSLLEDENFVNLLRAEGLDTLPRPLDTRIRARSGVVA